MLVPSHSTGSPPVSVVSPLVLELVSVPVVVSLSEESTPVEVPVVVVVLSLPVAAGSVVPPVVGGSLAVVTLAVVASVVAGRRAGRRASGGTGRHIGGRRLALLGRAGEQRSGDEGERGSAASGHLKMTTPTLRARVNRPGSRRARRQSAPASELVLET
ncbi:hypothetical protein [Nannocystis pusilla]|uniref:hypothetical protein n=1 Tax=Nannocystis pusilla TaxID=889268 RepID=UPI003B79924E